MTEDGPQAQAPFTMLPSSRYTVKVNDALPDKDLSTRMQASQPITGERAPAPSGVSRTEDPKRTTPEHLHARAGVLDP